MEWLRQLLEKAKITDGKLDVTELMSTVTKEFPKHAVPKDTFNNTNEQLKTANKTIDDLKKSNKDNDALQTTIENHKKQIEDKEKELGKLKKESYLKDEYRKAGIKEEYLDLVMKTSNLEEIAETNGEYLGADKLIKASVETYKDLFNAKKEGSEGSDPTYIYTPESGEGEVGSVNFLDIITENQVKR
ncbi:MAG: phage scaffolding protein [Clostridium sp.]